MNECGDKKDGKIKGRNERGQGKDEGQVGSKGKKDQVEGKKSD